jgi:hypothetical protein
MEDLRKKNINFGLVAPSSLSGLYKTDERLDSFLKMFWATCIERLPFLQAV